MEDNKNRCPCCGEPLTLPDGERPITDFVGKAYGLLYRQTESLMKQNSAELAVQEQIRRNLETLMHAWDGA